MTKSLRFLLLIFLLHFSVTAQEIQYRTYNECISQARQFQNQNKTDSALQYYDSAFKKINWVPYDYLAAGISAFIANDYDLVNAYLTKGIIKGWSPFDMQIDLLQPYYSSKQYQNLLIKYDSLHNVHWNSIDTNYANQLQSLFESQLEYKKKFIDQNLPTNEILFGDFLELVELHGYPTYEKVGASYINAYFILLDQKSTYPTHTFWTKLFPYIDKEIEAGKVSPIFYIRLEEEKDL